MTMLQLLPIGELDNALLHQLGVMLAAQFQTPFEVLPVSLDIASAYHAERQQHHSSELLTQMRALATPTTWRMLGVTALDLYIPILTFVFGEAHMGGPCAVVSIRRLTQEFYGLPPDAGMLRDRLFKEAVHELGHTLHLTHCEDYRCVMASSHAVEWIDLKESTLCRDCQANVDKVLGAPSL